MTAVEQAAACAQVKATEARKWVSTWPHHHAMLLSLMVIASVVVRLAALALWRTGAIGSEGAEYARIAENLRNGLGYVGIAPPGPESMFPPGYPLLIAGASLVTRNYEWAARV